MTSRKACAQLVRGKRIRRGGGEGEGEGGKEDVIMTFSYVKMWWRFFNATLSWIYSVCVTSLILVYPCCYVLFQSEMHPWPDWILCWKITRLNEGIGLGYGVHEFLKNVFNLVFPSLSPPLFPLPFSSSSLPLSFHLLPSPPSPLTPSGSWYRRRYIDPSDSDEVWNRLGTGDGEVSGGVQRNARTGYQGTLT